MTKQDSMDNEILFSALKIIGNNESARKEFTKALLKIEKILTIENKSVRDDITGPLVDSLYAESSVLSKSIKGGLIFDFYYNSKIAREFIMSIELEPDHVWEPQTTRVLKYFSKGAKNVIVGGAFFGDQVIIISDYIKDGDGVCHAFEPNQKQFKLLEKNIIDNNLNNTVAHKLALWSSAGKTLNLGYKSKVISDKIISKPFSLMDEATFTALIEKNKLSYNYGKVYTTTIDNYGKENNLDQINLIMLDLEGSEIKALKGAQHYLNKKDNKPVVVFEIHKLYEDWNSGLNETKIVKFLESFGYKLFAIRDYQGNVNMSDRPIELIPSNNVYLKGPPHGFNMLAIEDISQLNDEFILTENVSPKLLKHKDPALHQPLH